MFDCAAQIIFTSSRQFAMRDLLPQATPAYQNYISTWSTTWFMIGWASGGLIFGIVGDKWGRAKTMGLCILMYAVFTGLSALARTWQEFAFSRFITGFGVGGEFAAGAVLVADVMPHQARAQRWDYSRRCPPLATFWELIPSRWPGGGPATTITSFGDISIFWAQSQHRLPCSFCSECASRTSGCRPGPPRRNRARTISDGQRSIHASQVAEKHHCRASAGDLRGDRGLGNSASTVRS